MKIPFFKYQGTGNDFVIIDDRDNEFDKTDHKLVIRLCDRRFGVGADGLMLLRSHADYDFEMVYFNADGYEGSMCGNGGRALVQFAFDQGVITNSTRFIATDGEHEAELIDGLVKLKMIEVNEVEKNEGFYFMDTGSPHYVEFSKELGQKDIVADGRSVRYNERFKEVGTNVNFVEEIRAGEIAVRTYERGVEDETLSCGTGVTAATIAYSDKFKVAPPVQISVLGGQLAVDFEKEKGVYRNVYLIGPAQKVFQGEFDTDILEGA